jgi:hypothetical protein
MKKRARSKKRAQSRVKLCVHKKGIRRDGKKIEKERWMKVDIKIGERLGVRRYICVERERETESVSV